MTAPEDDLETGDRIPTIAELPFHMMGRFPKPLTIGRCRGDQVDGMSSKQVFERIRDVSLGLTALGVSPRDRVAIVAESRPEWILCDLGILAAGAVTVPIYPTLSAAQARYILQDSGARVAIVSTADQLGKLQEVRHLLPLLEAVVVMDAGAGQAASVLTMDEVARRGHARMTGEWGAGRTFREAARQVAPGDLATIIYTSGTTGEPKGVMLTHGNLVANLEAGSEVLALSQEDVALSFLPLSHSFERMVSYIYLYAGVTIVFAESMETIGRDSATVRPTVVTGVPRVYEKMQTRIVTAGEAASPAKAAIFRWAVKAGVAKARARLTGRTPGPIVSAKAAVADRLVFSTIRQRLGGRIRFFVSGSAPLGVSVLEFFHGIGLPIVEGYGLTETAPILTVNPTNAPRVGTVGRPLPNVELRIADDGEILARGPNVMTGYYNKPEATAEVMKDGWFATGDIGTLDAEGYLRITDRKKDILVTSGGKNIAPQPIEDVLRRSPLVAEAVVLGDRRRYVAALLVPEFTALERRLEGLGRPPAPRDELVTRPDVVALYQEIVDGLNRDLSPYERVKRMALLPSEFSVGTGELTPTLKVKRRVVEERWRAQIEALYRD
ncbi:MAG: long-chain fatty acid--CoA ligase [Acidobacteriota bacterium]|nr:long-chain fatty acid--CoA ligase [Acidobacteriota bacterium]